MFSPQSASRVVSCLAAATLLFCISPCAVAQATQGAPALPPSSTNGQNTTQQNTSSPQTATPQAATPQATSPQAAPGADVPQAATPAPPSADAATQQQPEASGNGAFTLRTFVPEVDLVFTVTDGKGHFVTGLKQSDLGLLDDGKRPDRVISFTQQANLPLRIGILLDTSNSIRSRFQFEQQAATEFLLQVLRPRQDAAFITGFDVRLDLAQDYTNSIDKLSTAIEKLRPGGGTAFFDAIYQTCRDQMLTVKSNETLRKAIIVVSDGEDNYSRVYEQDAIKECQRAETIVYTISTNVSPSRSKGDDVLTRLSDATGGRAFFPTKIEDVANGFRAIEEELRSQYSLRYRPADLKQDGAFRSIYLVSIDQRYHVRALKGYFAPRPPR